MDRKVWTWLWVTAGAVYILLGVLNLFFGELNQDEGWYLYAARMVAEGKYPYIDFAYPQGPVLPFVYVLAQPLVDVFGVAGGRVFSALLGIIGAGMVSLLAARLVSPGKSRIAAFMAFCLAGINVYQSYYLTSVKTYSLCGLLIVAGFLALTFAKGERAWLTGCISGVLFAIAAGTRMSAIVILPVVFLVLFMAVVQVRKWQDTIDSSGAGAIIGNVAVLKINPFIWLWFAAGAILASLAIFLPFVIKAPAALWFALVEYHAGRSAGSLISLFAYKAGFVSRLVQAYFVPAALFLAGIIYLVINRGKHSGKSWLSVVGEVPLLRAVIIAMWLSIVVVSLVHVSAPFPYEDYQVMIFPLFAAALAIMLAEISVSESGQVSGFSVVKGDAWLSLVVLLLCVAASFSSPINQAWFAGQRDRIWWPLREESPLRKLQRVAGVVKSMTKPGDVLLTQDVYLAVETGLRLPKGLEMGQFSYFPFWSRGKAAACHVLNREMMMELLSSVEAPVAAFSGYGLTIGSPAVVRLPKVETDVLWNVVNDRYVPFEDVPNFGQADTTLRILTRKK